MLTGLDAVFAPRRVAVVGASERAGTVGRLIWDNLADFPGEVLPISRSKSIFGRPAYAGLLDAPGDIDLVVLAVPAAGALEVIRAAAAKRVAAALILSAGFAETGRHGALLQREILDVARTTGMRLVGPNSFGVQNRLLPLNASIAPAIPASAPVGAAAGHRGISLITQSGAYGMAVNTLANDESMPVAKVFAAGNKADIADHEVLAYLTDDPETSAICLLLESISHPREFFEQARRATGCKPVIATVTGRSAAGRRAAMSHTASMATDDLLCDAMLRQAGVVRTRTGVQMLDGAQVVAGQSLPAGSRVGIITNSGGIGVELADLLVDEGLCIPELSEPLQAQLRDLLPAFASPGNPVDLTPAWVQFPELYAGLITELARSGEVDIVVPVLLQRAAAEPVAAAVRDAVQALRAELVTVPVYVCWVAPRDAQRGADLLRAAGVPCLPWPERTARAVGVAVRCATAISAGPIPFGQTRAATARSPVSTPRTTRAAARPNVSASSYAGVIAQRDLLIRAGVRVARTELCRTPQEATAQAARIGYPVVLKVEHPDLSHKSEVNGVRTSLSGPDAVRQAADELLALAPGARVIVQQQHQGLELVVGAIRDPGLGPMVMVGMGGIHVEVLADTRYAVAPIDLEEATRMWSSLRLAALLDGVRGRPAVDIDGLAALAVTVGDLMVTTGQLHEIDLNPVLAGPDGHVVVDWRMTGDFLPPGGESD